MIPQGSSLQNQSSSGVGGGDVWRTGSVDFGTHIVNTGGGGFTISTPIMVVGLVLASFIAYKVLK